MHCQVINFTVGRSVLQCSMSCRVFQLCIMMISLSVKLCVSTFEPFPTSNIYTAKYMVQNFYDYQTIKN